MSTLHWTRQNGQPVTYADKENTPVALNHYRCKSRLVTTAHVCKITVDHDGDHRCVCGKSWPNSQSKI